MTVQSPNIFCPYCGAQVSLEHIIYLWKLVPNMKGWVSACNECAYMLGNEITDVEFDKCRYFIGSVYKLPPPKPDFIVHIKGYYLGTEKITEEMAKEYLDQHPELNLTKISF